MARVAIVANCDELIDKILQHSSTVKPHIVTKRSLFKSVRLPRLSAVTKQSLGTSTLLARVEKLC